MPIEMKDETSMEDILELILFMDGSSTDKRSRARIVIITLDKVPLSSAIQFSFEASNNEAKYEALVDLWLEKELKVRKFKVFNEC